MLPLIGALIDHDNGKAISQEELLEIAFLYDNSPSSKVRRGVSSPVTVEEKLQTIVNHNSKLLVCVQEEAGSETHLSQRSVNMIVCISISWFRCHLPCHLRGREDDGVVHPARNKASGQHYRHHHCVPPGGNH